MRPEEQPAKPVTYRPAPETLTRDGITVRQIWRGALPNGKPIAVYRCDAGFSSPYDRYDVVLLRKAEATSIYGRDYPARETYPTAESWGTNGWTVVGMDALRSKLSALGVKWKDMPSDSRFC